MPTATGTSASQAPALSNYLEVNIPRYGVITSLMYFGEKPSTKKPGTVMPAQFGFKGTWETEHGPVEGMTYVDQHKLDTDLIELGFVTRGEDYQGQPRFNWTEPGRVQLLMKLLPGNKRQAFVTRVAGDPTGQHTPSAPSAPVQAQPATQTRPWPPIVTSEPTAPAPMTEDPWGALALQYERCRKIACQVWGEDFDAEALVAATATLFIQSSKLGIR